VKAPDEVGSVGNGVEGPHFELSRRDEGVARIRETITEDDEPVDRRWLSIGCGDLRSDRHDGHEHGNQSSPDHS
jgi:hypothetical protein